VPRRRGGRDSEPDTFRQERWPVRTIAHDYRAVAIRSEKSLNGAKALNPCRARDSGFTTDAKQLQPSKDASRTKAGGSRLWNQLSRIPRRAPVTE
jgi:hypothetical protein